MVKINEIKGLFWGVTLEGDKKYTQTPERPVHISMAALDTMCPQADGSTASVMIEYNGSSFVLCTLQHGKLFQQPLDLEFASGETLSFYLTGKGSVHLSGYCLPEDDDYNNSFDSDSDDASEPLSDDEDLSNDSEDEDDEGSNAKTGKRKLVIKGGKNAKKARMTIDDLDEDEDDSEDDDFNWSDNDDSDEDQELQDDFDEESDSDEPAKPAAKKAKQGNGTSEKAAVVNVKSKEKPGKATTPTSAPTSAASQPQTSNTGSAEAEGKKKKKKKKKNKNKNSGENQQQESGTKPDEQKAPVASKLPTKRVAEGGVVIEDLKEGHGPEARVGKMVRVYYTGRLANGKVFDACVSGNGFKFKLGKKEVISGWDVGVSGMKVGGKRKLIIPPKMGYGSRPAGPIPANSTLVFDVELKAVN